MILSFVAVHADLGEEAVVEREVVLAEMPVVEAVGVGQVEAEEATAVKEVRKP